MRFLDKINRFMYGRHGMDNFGRFLFGLSVVFWLISAVLRWTPWRGVYFIFWLLNTAIYIYAFFRILSKNTYQRTVENEWYLRMRERFLPFIRSGRQRIADREHVYRKCRFCGAKLRLKRVRGTHTARCPQCGKTFKVRVFTDPPEGGYSV